MIDFIMTNLPIIVCFVLGIGLLIVEALMPGFGIVGFSGIALEDSDSANDAALRWRSSRWC